MQRNGSRRTGVEVVLALIPLLFLFFIVVERKSPAEHQEEKMQQPERQQQPLLKLVRPDGHHRHHLHREATQAVARTCDLRHGAASRIT